MADALITKLGNLKHVIVRPTSAVRKYADAGGDSLAAGRELGVEAVLEGNIQRTEDRIHVTVRLLRVGDGAEFWSETIEDNSSTSLRCRIRYRGRLLRP